MALVLAWLLPLKHTPALKPRLPAGCRLAALYSLGCRACVLHLPRVRRQHLRPREGLHHLPVLLQGRHQPRRQDLLAVDPWPGWRLHVHCHPSTKHLS